MRVLLGPGSLAQSEGLAMYQTDFWMEAKDSLSLVTEAPNEGTSYTGVGKVQPLGMASSWA